MLLCDLITQVLLFQDSSGGPQERVRRPLNAFMLFYQDQLAALKQANQGVGHKEFSKLMGAKWRETPEADKKKYYELATKVRALFKMRFIESKLRNTTYYFFTNMNICICGQITIRLLTWGSKALENTLNSVVFRD